MACQSRRPRLGVRAEGRSIIKFFVSDPIPRISRPHEFVRGDGGPGYRVWRVPGMSSHFFPGLSSPARALPCEFISSTRAGCAGPLLLISNILNPKKAHRLTIHGLCLDSGPSRSRSLWSWWTATSVLCKTISNAVDLGVFKGLVHLPWSALWGLNSLGFAICPISPFAFFLFHTISWP